MLELLYSHYDYTNVTVNSEKPILKGPFATYLDEGGPFWSSCYVYHKDACSV